MSKRIIISESEKNQIKSLYQLNEGRKIDILNGEEFQINIGGGPRTYRINGIYASNDEDSAFIVNTTQVNTGVGKDGKDKGTRFLALGDENAGKQFIFKCLFDDNDNPIGYLGGFDGKNYIGTENYKDTYNQSVKEINEFLRNNLCK
jgi:hypothetical protein